MTQLTFCPEILHRSKADFGMLPVPLAIFSVRNKVAIALERKAATNITTAFFIVAVSALQIPLTSAVIL